jgi:hypothetical protein
MHSASVLSQLLPVFSLHVSTTVSQRPFEKPDLQEQEYDPTPSLHVPPFWQGEEVQSFALISQLNPM